MVTFASARETRDQYSLQGERRSSSEGENINELTGRKKHAEASPCASAERDKGMSVSYRTALRSHAIHSPYHLAATADSHS